MAFTWKDKRDIFKGEGIYHLTFVVVNRARVLGTLRPLNVPDSDGHIATVDISELGNEVYREINGLRNYYPQIQILGKQIMPDHLHVVVWMKEGFTGSIKSVARGFSQGCSKIARRIAAEQRAALRCGSGTADAPALPSLGAQLNCADTNGTANNGMTHNGTANNGMTHNGTANNGMVHNGTANGGMAHNGTANGGMDNTQPSPYDCGNGANTLFATPFIRTLAHAGQLNDMIRYVHNNPSSAWMRRIHPDLYVIRRRMEYAGLHFDAMGKARLMAWPDRQVIALSRSLTQEQIDAEVKRALRMAESGTLICTAAINDGERAVAKAVREAGYPLVIMMLEGFPAEGTEAARYFHPHGVYHQACGEGKLYVLAPHSENYADPRVIEGTEAELLRKAALKGYSYRPIPHDSTRWRMIAGNVMLGMVFDGNP